MTKLDKLNTLVDNYAKNCDNCQNIECRKAEAVFINKVWKSVTKELSFFNRGEES